MTPVGEVPVEATVGLEQVKWGTRLLLTCTYEPQSVEYDLPPAVDYTLFVRTRDGYDGAGRQLALDRRHDDAPHGRDVLEPRGHRVSGGAHHRRTSGPAHCAA